MHISDISTLDILQEKEEEDEEDTLENLIYHFSTIFLSFLSVILQVMVNFNTESFRFPRSSSSFSLVVIRILFLGVSIVFNL